MSLKNKNKFEAKNRTIYMIKNPMSREFIIDYTLTKNLYSTYKNHYNCLNRKTTIMVDNLRRHNLKPCCFVLETLEATTAEAYCHAVIWTKHFIDQGFENIDNRCGINFSSGLSSGNEKLLRQIAPQFPSEIIDCQFCKFPNYGRYLCPLYKCLDESKTPKIG